jgi:DNA polymerase III gamma/tau subunit
MFLKNPKDILQTIDKVHFAIFEFPKSLDFPEIPRAININPNDKNNITIEDIRDVEELVRTKQPTSLIIVVNHADRMTEQAQNCFLKLLEEPGLRIHFVFFTHSPNKLLPTIRSRAHSFHLKSTTKIDSPPIADPKTTDLAKQYISATPRQLATLSQALAKDREKALEILDVAIELLYKSYFKTGNHKFLGLLEKLTHTHDCLAKNGHVRLQLVAGML